MQNKAPRRPRVKAAGGNKGRRKRSLSLARGQETSVNTLRDGKRATRTQIIPSGKNLSPGEKKMAPSPRLSATASVPAVGSHSLSSPADLVLSLWTWFSELGCSKGHHRTGTAGGKLVLEGRTPKAMTQILGSGRDPAKEQPKHRPQLPDRLFQGFSCQNIVQAPQRPAKQTGNHAEFN